MSGTKRNKDNLTPLQKQWCELYVVTGNGVFSYREVFQPKPESSVESIYKNVNKLFKKQAVVDYIERLQEKQAKEYEDKAHEVLDFLIATMEGRACDELVMPYKGKFLREYKKISHGDRMAAAKILAQRFGIDQPLTGPPVQKMDINITYGTPNPGTSNPETDDTP